MKPSHYSQCQASHKGNPKSTGIGAVYNGNQLSNPVLHFGSDVAKSLLPHSKEERDRIETANRKAEDEAFVRDSFGIHPDEQPLIQGCIDQINQRLKEAAGLGRKARQLAFEIGVELVGLKEDKVYPGKWTEFCKAKFPEIHQRVLENCMQLAKNQGWLETKYQKSNQDSFFEVCPSMKQMLEDIQGRNREVRAAQGKSPIKHRSAPKEKQSSQSIRDVPSETAPPAGRFRLETTTARFLPALDDEPYEILITAEQLAKLCPACRPVLEALCRPTDYPKNP